MATEPERPVVADPVLNSIFPLEPLLATPEENSKAPVKPFDPASTVFTTIPPEELAPAPPEDKDT